jgi:4'-phosphopantetheinyl transferase
MSQVEVSTVWEGVRTPPALSDRAAHVWRFTLDPPPDELDKLKELLDDDERRRAARFVRPELRSRFAAGRGMLRTILAAYLGVAPAALRFEYNGYGKPSLAATTGPAPHPGGEPLDLRFNLSHSGQWALLAVALGRELGVDIEAIRPEWEFEKLAEHFFSAAEVAALMSTPDTARRRAFFSCWTRKEAYIKALGRGLAVPLDSFDVSLAPGLPAELLAVRDLPLEPARWLMTALEPARDYLGALCVERPIDAIWQGEWG